MQNKNSKLIHYSSTISTSVTCSVYSIYTKKLFVKAFATNSARECSQLKFSVFFGNSYPNKAICITADNIGTRYIRYTVYMYYFGQPQNRLLGKLVSLVLNT